MSIIAPPRPSRVVRARLCERCPFRADGSGYATAHVDFPGIVRSVELGLPFYCHETVILDPRTTIARGEPSPIPQAHFELCRGGHERRMRSWRAGVIAAGHEPGEVTPSPVTVVTSLHAHFSPARLDRVIAEMARRGAPRLRAYRDAESGAWFTSEGTHRLRAAAQLGIAPILISVPWWRSRAALERARYAAVLRGHAFRGVRIATSDGGAA